MAAPEARPEALRAVARTAVPPVEAATPVAVVEEVTLRAAVTIPPEGTVQGVPPPTDQVPTILRAPRVQHQLRTLTSEHSFQKRVAKIVR